MAKLTIELTGVDAVIKNFRKFGLEGRKVVSDITQIQALDIERDAKQNAPVDTGKLRQAIKAEKFGFSQWTITAYEIYSVWVEFGTSKMSAQPFLHPAWKQGIKSYLRDLDTALERLGKKYSS